MNTVEAIAEVRYARANGVRIAYRDEGRGDPLVLVHGSWGSLENWESVVPLLAPHHRVISYDRRGHSASECVTGQGLFSEDVADLAGLIEALDAAPAWVAGNSVGAIIALRLAAVRPDLIRGLVVHEPPLRTLLPDDADQRMSLVLDLIRSGDHAGAAQAFVDGIALGAGAWRVLSEKTRATMIRNAPTFLDEELAPDSRLVDPAALSRYTGPALISAGGRSPAIFGHVAEHLAAMLPQARRIQYADAGHVPHLSHPEQFADAIRAFTSLASPSTQSSGAATSAATERGPVFEVPSRDGTRIAVWVEGEGPAVVLVHGSLQDHTISAALVAELSRDFTTFAVDRRGFGASGDGAQYAIDSEFADVATVVDAVAAQVGGPVVLWGHSYGASVAMGAATLTSNVSHLVLYEPSLGLHYPSGWIETLEETLARGDDEQAIELVLRDILEFPDEQIEAMRSGPEWAKRVAVAKTVPREARAEESWVFRPGDFAAVSAPTLLLSGSESTVTITRATHAAAAAIAGARIRILQGHAHIAHRVDPRLVADLIGEFVSSG